MVIKYYTEHIYNSYRAKSREIIGRVHDNVARTRFTREELRRRRRRSRTHANTHARTHARRSRCVFTYGFIILHDAILVISFPLSAAYTCV